MIPRLSCDRLLILRAGVKHACDCVAGGGLRGSTPSCSSQTESKGPSQDSTCSRLISYSWPYPACQGVSLPANQSCVTHGNHGRPLLGSRPPLLTNSHNVTALNSSNDSSKYRKAQVCVIESVMLLPIIAWTAPCSCRAVRGWIESDT